MFNQFAALLADALAMLLLARCLLQYGRLNYMHPLAQFCCRSSDWLVKPLRRLLPPLGGLYFGGLAAVCGAVFVVVAHQFAGRDVRLADRGG